SFAVNRRRQTNGGNRRIDTDPQIGRIAGLRRISAQIIGADDHDPETKNAVLFNVDIERTGAIGIVLPMFPIPSAIARAPQFDFGDSCRTHGIDFVVETELSSVGHSRPLTVGQGDRRIVIWNDAVPGAWE